MKKEDGYLEDFRALRAEMITIFNTRIWGILTFIIAAGGLASIETDNILNCYKYLAIIYISPPLLIHSIHRERSRIRIANYIKTFIEPNLKGIFWENYLVEWRNNVPLKYIDEFLHGFSILGVNIIIVTFAFFAIVKNTDSISKDCWILIFAIIGVFLNFLCVIYQHCMNARCNNVDWKKDVLKEFKENDSPVVKKQIDKKSSKIS